MEQIVARNVVILFEPERATSLCDLSARVHAQTSSHILLNNTDQLPHLSLYNTCFPEDALASVVDALGTLAQQLSPVTMRIRRKSFTSGYIFLDADIDEPLTSLHEQIVNALTALRRGAFNEKELALPGITPEMKDNLINTGMVYSMRLFKPHVTITKLENLDDGPAALATIPDDINFTARVQSIHFVESGPHGTCKKMLKSFALGQ